MTWIFATSLSWGYSAITSPARGPLCMVPVRFPKPFWIWTRLYWMHPDTVGNADFWDIAPIEWLYLKWYRSVCLPDSSKCAGLPETCYKQYESLRTLLPSDRKRNYGHIWFGRFVIQPLSRFIEASHRTILLRVGQHCSSQLAQACPWTVS